MKNDFTIKREFGHNFLIKYTGQESSPTLPEEIEIIGKGAFANCEYLQNIKIHSGVTEIRDEAFAKCKNLASVEIADGLRLIGYAAFFECTALTKLNFPNSLLKIGDCAFDSCEKITFLSIPNIIIIGYFAFRGCSSLTFIEILSDVEEIGGEAFFECPLLSKVIVHGDIERIHPSAFNGSDNLVIHAPEGSFATEYAKEKDIKYVET